MGIRLKRAYLIFCCLIWGFLFIGIFSLIIFRYNIAIQKVLFHHIIQPYTGLFMIFTFILWPIQPIYSIVVIKKSLRLQAWKNIIVKIIV